MIHKTDDAEHSGTVTWCPYVLRPSFLGLLSASALTLSFVVALLCGISGSRNGLGSDDGSSILLFGWRFTPSLVAVLYVQLTSMLLDGIKISEPFARLARSGGAPAAYTLFQPPGAWWDALADGLSTKKNGGRRSWVLICSACLNIIGFLAISPLSSSLLLSEDVLITQNVEFSRVVLNQGFSPLRIRTGRDTYLRTMGHILQNVSTSAWLSDDYAILPFWPSRIESVPLSPFLSTSQETWESETLVLKSELECNSMALAATGFTNDTFRYSYDNNETEARTRSNDKASIMLAADDGCTYGLALATDMEMVMRGGTSWSDVSTFIDRDQGQLREDLASSLYARLNHSEECGQRELLFATTPWNSSAGNFSFVPDFKVSAKICETKYFMAEMTVKGTLSEESLRSALTRTSSGRCVSQSLTVCWTSTDYKVSLSARTGPIIRPCQMGKRAPLLAGYQFSLRLCTISKCRHWWPQIPIFNASARILSRDFSVKRFSSPSFRTNCRANRSRVGLH